MKKTQADTFLVDTLEPFFDSDEERRNMEAEVRAFLSSIFCKSDESERNFESGWQA